MDTLKALNLAQPIADTYNALETMLLRHIADQLAANPDTLINATSKWRIKMLAQMGRLDKSTAKTVADMTGKVPDEVEGVVDTAINEVLAEYGLTMTKALSENISGALKSYDRQAVISKYNQVNTVMQYKAKQLYASAVNGVADRFDRIKQKALDNAQEYLDTLNENALAAAIGERSRTEALRETIAEMSRKGIPAFVDAAGREWSPEAYINMDICNTAKNAALAAEFSSLEELGQDVVLISSHSGARPKCFPYQGKFFSLSGKSGTITDANGKTYTYSPLSETSYGEPDGLLGINCGHRMRGVSDGGFINREKEYDEGENSKEYEQVQRQRTQERRIRKEKTQAEMLEAAGDKEGAKEYRSRAALHQRELKQYCEENGLRYRRDRTETYGYKDKTAKVDISGESGIIKAEERHHKIVEGKNAIGNWTRRENFENSIDDIIDYQGFNGKPHIIDNRDEFNALVDNDHFIGERTIRADSQEKLDEYIQQLKCINGNDYFYVNCGIGGAQYGQGMYCAADYTKGTVARSAFEHEIRQYGGEHQATVWLTMDKSAKILELPHRQKAAEYISSEYRYAYMRKYATPEQKELVENYISSSRAVDNLTLSESEEVIDAAYNRRNHDFEFVKDLANKAMNLAANKDPGVMAAEMGYDAINARGHGRTGSYTVVLNRTKLIIYGGSDYDYGK